ncbi:MAG: hemerythrin family protein [Rhodobacterales bacterium]|nr:hemerythrin family protein [Rhodobacterales bacterium]
MTAITWSAELEIGIRAIDTDHKVLVSLINQLDEALRTAQPQETVGSVLNALVDYTEYHFGREEALMRACDYAELDGHHIAHEKLTAQVLEIRDSFAADPATVDGHGVLAFLQNWLTKHIMGEDKRYAPYMLDREVDMEHANALFLETLSMSDDRH